jgi:hypothetical protein
MPVTLAQAALAFAKACTPHGPDNQAVGQLSAPKPWNPGRSPATRQDAKLAVADLKKLAPNAGCSMDDVVAYGREVMKRGAGNCLEQCAAAALYLAGQREQPPFRLVYLAPPADHIFVVLGQAPAGDGSFPDAFAQWSAGAVVVDPWVGICVKARHYPEMWRMKLDVMGAAGEELAGGGWKKANAAYWKTAPTAHRKLSYTT